MTIQGIIFANIYDSSLGELTNKRTMASLPYGGRYRQIDFTLSNMANADIRRIGIISRYHYQSLMAHIGSGEEWDLELKDGGLEYLTPYSTSSTSGYRGKLEALHYAMGYLEKGAEDSYVILADSSVLCNIDLLKAVDAHVQSGKDLTIIAVDGVANGRKQLDLAMKLDADGEIEDMAVDYVAPEGYLASTGMFIISKRLLMACVENLVARNRYRFERDLVLPLWLDRHQTMNVYRFDGVTLFNESPEEYYNANLALLDKDVRDGLFRDRPIYTTVRDCVPTYYGENTNIDNCIVADGCMLEGDAKESVLFRQVTLRPGAKIEGCLVMNDTVIGENCELKCVILDKNVTVRPGAKLIGTPQNPIIIKRGETV